MERAALGENSLIKLSGVLPLTVRASVNILIFYLMGDMTNTSHKIGDLIDNAS
ncbi:MAG: hypothetical protein JXA35_10355 [Deltaproteobacteria bacterium]|nr:hypothetical protein [Deltaproteobacteria bacterium]